ncbi:MAG: glycosyltransferase family 2 protein [Actinobacteria bacterium]|nr:glycosyltransferase family 2 protein [Actinomycetota bacterium]
MPTYNGERYLRPCLESILAQSHADFELLLVDDASSDRTPALATEYAARDARVRVTRNPHNLGLVGNWNRCLELARAPWIKFAFQDDLLAPDCLARMLAAGATRPIVFARREFLFEDATPEEVSSTYRALPCIHDVLGHATDVTADAVCEGVLREQRNFFGEPTAALLHRSLFERFGIFNSDLAHLCDLEFWMRAATNTGLAWIDTPLATFRYHCSSTSAGNLDPSREELIFVFDRLIIQHEVAYSDAFANLRRAASQRGPRRDFEGEFTAKATWVWRRAVTGGDARWRQRWEALAPCYAGFAATARRADRLSLRKWWARHVGWRLDRPRRKTAK